MITSNGIEIFIDRTILSSLMLWNASLNSAIFAEHVCMSMASPSNLQDITSCQLVDQSARATRLRSRLPACPGVSVPAAFEVEVATAVDISVFFVCWMVEAEVDMVDVSVLVVAVDVWVDVEAISVDQISPRTVFGRREDDPEKEIRGK